MLFFLSSTPDSNIKNTLIFASRTDASIRTIYADGTEMKVIWLGIANSYPSSPSWSPDGRLVVFSVSYPASQSFTEIHVLTIDTGKENIYILQGSKYPAEPVWSYSGKQIMYISEQNGCRRAYIMDLDGSNQKPVLSDIPCISSSSSEHYNAIWSPSGRYIGVVSLEGQAASTIVIDAQTLKIYSKTPTHVGNFGVSYGFDWSSNDSLLVYPAGADQHLCIYDLQVSNEKCFPNLSNISRPIFSPDGKYIVASVGCIDICKISIVSLEGVISDLLIKTTSNLNLTPIRWSPDRNQIILYSCEVDSCQLMVWDFTKGQTIFIAAQGYDPTWKPDNGTR